MHIIKLKTIVNRKTYTFDEAFKASLDYFTGDELAAKVWVNKYALKDAFGNIYEESPVDMHHRLASEIARVEKKYPNPLSEEELFALFDHFRYIVPQGSPMTGIGNDFQIASLSNCFVIGLDGDADSYGAIIRIDEEQVQLMKRRGGVGHDLSHIRPKGSPVKNSALTSTGLVPFMERYSNSTREVAQDGRRGALMLSVSIKHPDSESFIDAKMTEGKVTGANVSVKIDDEFMQAVINGTPYKQQYPIDSSEPTNVKEINAAELWKKIIHNAWKSAEPGVLFWDTSLFPIRMRISDSVRFRPTLAVRSPCARMIAAVCWQSTYIHMLSIHSQKRLISILTCSGSMLSWRNVSWMISSTWNQKRLKRFWRRSMPIPNHWK